MSDSETLQSMIEEEGIHKVKEAVKEGFRKRDERSLVNIRLTGSIH